ncbi:MAG TPA: phage tail protein [Gaiellaceae bacterium]|jgi:phage tail-like protein
MPQFPVNPARLDPYKNFRFRVKWDGRYVAGVSRVSALRRVTAAVDERSGGDASSDRRSPGTTTWAPIVLERGKTQDLAFEEWANLVWNESAPMSLKSFRKEVLVELLNEQGSPVLAYRIHRAWPSEYTALSDLDAEANAVAVETLVLEHEGWERDTAVTEPVET